MRAWTQQQLNIKASTACVQCYTAFALETDANVMYGNIACQILINTLNECDARMSLYSYSYY